MKIQSPKAMEEPRDDNIVVQQWHWLAINNLLVGCFSKFLKLVLTTIVQVIGNAKYEKTFSTLTFMKFKPQNWLAWHLDIVICMFIQDFFIEDIFPFQVAITN
jgi:hypothetical protein